MDNTDLTNKLVQYESGNLTDKESVELFQFLIDTGMAWELQGHYGRMSEDLIEKGLCVPREKATAPV